MCVGPARGGKPVCLPMHTFSVNCDRRSDAFVVTVRGELDLAALPRLQPVVNDAVRSGLPRVVIDLCGVSFMDSTGLGLLMNALRRLEYLDRRLLIACVDGPVRRVFALTRLSSQFELFESAGDALAAKAA
ncbi:MAG: Anti-sigma factor antagonist RsbV [Solirubrobacterales bacterium]|jgi:anti-sigma B factor antagonist|nr:Anti-sigma factor antagonist RsbV [Solirubrobacterales bacterium]